MGRHRNSLPEPADRPANTPVERDGTHADPPDATTPISSGLILPPPPPPGVVATDASFGGSSGARLIVCSLPRGRAGAAALTRAWSGESATLQSKVNMVLAVKDAMLAERSYVEESGEILTGLVLTLILADGTCVRTWSSPAIQAFGLIAQLCGEPTWEPALKLRVVGRKAADVGTILGLVIDEEG